MRSLQVNFGALASDSYGIMLEKLNFNPLGWMIAVSALSLFVCSSLRHALFYSSAWDLGIFDQAVYLLSSGMPPTSSFLGFHILGDHAAWIVYPLALLYKIYPDVHWLLAIQAIALAVGALPTWHLARQAQLSARQAMVIAAVYLLYPLAFNINLFDFHPEVMALPAILAAVLAGRRSATGWFCFSIIFILGCKDALSLTVAALGLLLLLEKRRLCGAIAIAAGVGWLLIATQEVIPHFGGELASVGRHLPRYGHLGNSFPEITKNLLTKPDLVLGKVFSSNTVEYLALLLVPLIWGLSPQHLLPLVGAIPTLAMNILADDPLQRDLTHQYSLPLIPFLILAVISTLAAGGGWVRSGRFMVLWSLVAFIALAKFGYFWSIYLNSLDTWQATRAAIAQVQTQGGVLTSAEIAPHLTHRPLVNLTNAKLPPTDLTKFDYVLLNLRHPGWLSNREFANGLVNQLKNNQKFQLSYQRDDVYLFKK